jgi:RimJ/RimL family protein N-acetyltransferase
MDIVIRRAGESDWQELRSVRLKALLTDPSVFCSNHQTESAMSETEWKEWLRGEDKAVFLLYEKDILIGMTGIAVMKSDPSMKTAILWGSWLEPQARGKGLSKCMYEKRIEWAKKHPSVERIVVSHRASNLSSKRANQKYGFQFTHVIEDETWPDGTREDNVFYSLSVKP